LERRPKDRVLVTGNDVTCLRPAHESRLAASELVALAFAKSAVTSPSVRAWGPSYLRVGCRHGVKLTIQSGKFAFSIMFCFVCTREYAYVGAVTEHVVAVTHDLFVLSS
jgi:hypothetical protein